MGLQDSALIFGMELCADIPAMLGNLHNFHEVGIGILAATHHAVLLECFQKRIVELLAMAMALTDKAFAIDACYTRTLHQFTIVGTKSHRSTHL